MKCKKLALSLAAFLVASSIGVSKADGNFSRISGMDRYETSREAQKLINSKVVVFVDGRNFADSLSAVNLVHSEGAKVCLVNGNEDLSSYIKENGIEKAYIVGGPNSVSEDFEKRLKVSVPVERLAGANRYSTNMATLDKGNFKDILIANGNKYTEALSATRLLKEKNLGLMLTDSLVENSPDKFNVKYLVGGETAITDTQGDRIGGIDDTETSKLLAEKTDANNWVIVSGNNFADAISAINVSEAKDADILIAPEIGDSDYKAIEKSGNVYVVGGKDAISDAQIDFTLNADPKKADNTSEESVDYNNVVVNDNNKFVIKKENGKYYAYKDNAKVMYNQKSNGIYKVGNKAYMLAKDSSVLNGKFNVGKETYYSDLQNGLARGWKTIGRDVNYFSPYNYRMYKGGIFSTGKNAYWFDANGKVRTGAKKTGKGLKSETWYAPTKAEMVNINFDTPEAKKMARNQEAANFALRYEGLPFKWYGTDLTNGKGVYCCGAAYSAMKSVGVKIPGPNDMNMYAEGGYRMVKVQYLDAPKWGGRYLPIDLTGNTLQAGDLLYYTGFHSHYNHVSIYIGKNHGTPYIVHATLANGFTVDKATIVKYGWKYKDLKAVRF